MHTAVRDFSPKTCHTKGCTEPNYGRGLCRLHYDRKYRDSAASALWSKYRLTRAEKAAMIEAQGGVCGLCGQPDRNGATLHIDHDHRCCGPKTGCKGCIRGAICAACNHRLSIVENRDWMEMAIAYLETHKGQFPTCPLDGLTERLERIWDVDKPVQENWDAAMAL